MREVNVFSSFSGIGAFEKALERKGIGYNLVNYCEFDKYASKSYSLIHKVPETLNLGDITKVKIDELEPYSADLITYGFPCQDISNAGKQRGFEHDGQLTRSGLFFYAAAIIGRIQPKVAICENVKALVGKKFTKEFETVLSTLEDMGYTNYWQVLNAKDYGIPQNRERVFIVSIRNDIDKKYEFPVPIKLELRLKDILEKEVDEKYYLSNDKIKQFIVNNPNINMNNSVLGTCHERNDLSFAIRDRVYNTEKESPTLTSTMYKDAPKILQIGQLYGTEKEPNPQAGRIYDADGLSPTMDSCSGGNRMPKVLVKEATKKGYAEAHEGDSINLEQPNSKTRRGRVGRGVAQTLNTAPQQAVVEPNIEVIGNYSPSNRDASRIVHCNGIAPTVKENHGTVTATNVGLRIRKLTPKECFRLMGFDDADIDVLIENGISNTQLYKQAGNSIVVNVLEAIFDNLVDVFDV